MLAECSYSVAVWEGLKDWLGMTLHQPPNDTYRTFKTWWHNILNPHAPGAKERAQRVIYTMWNTRKERCRRVFENKGLSAAQLQVLIRQDVEQWNGAAWCQASSLDDPG
jgi:cyclopropane fatty-acyl-phospholipid synthase-like methyltransferase